MRAPITDKLKNNLYKKAIVERQNAGVDHREGFHENRT